MNKKYFDPELDPYFTFNKDNARLYFERYLEAEKALLDIYHMPWYKRLLCKKFIVDFARSRFLKYMF